ncbi:MAG: hypothetical protein KGN84_19325 [Acidobacteriota bacterium]|nr:hypothetical protein [Acidobacteriota bacterium]
MLHGSLPASRAFIPEGLTGGEAFVAMARLRDEARTGPFHLKRPDVAEVVQRAIPGDTQFHPCYLHTCVIMANHIRLLVTSKFPDGDEFGRTRSYIEWNPVKAGLTETPQGFPYSSAAPGGSPAARPTP